MGVRIVIDFLLNVLAASAIVLAIILVWALMYIVITSVTGRNQ